MDESWRPQAQLFFRDVWMRYFEARKAGSKEAVIHLTGPLVNVKEALGVLEVPASLQNSLKHRPSRVLAVAGREEAGARAVQKADQRWLTTSGRLLIMMKALTSSLDQYDTLAKSTSPSSSWRVDDVQLQSNINTTFDEVKLSTETQHLNVEGYVVLFGTISS